MWKTEKKQDGQENKEIKKIIRQKKKTARKNKRQRIDRENRKTKRQ